MKDAAHLLRLAGLFLGGTLLFLLVRGQVVPATWGQYGHFRGSALAQIRNRPLTFAGHETCQMCHEDQLKVLQTGKHAKISCEACHGPNAKHADDPSLTKPVLPDTKKLCAQCHEANPAKPKWFPQVVTKDHAGDEPCKTCHTPHRPKFEVKP